MVLTIYFFIQTYSMNYNHNIDFKNNYFKNFLKLTQVKMKCKAHDKIICILNFTLFDSGTWLKTAPNHMLLNDIDYDSAPTVYFYFVVFHFDLYCPKPY